MNFFESEVASDAIKAFMADYQSKDNCQYELNAEKCDKMNDIIAYCQAIEAKCDCKVIRCMLEPKHEQAYIQVLFSGELLLDKKDVSLSDFIKTLALCDGVNITTNPAGEDLFQMTFFVENLWIKKLK